MKIHVEIEGLEPGLMMNGLGGYGATIPEEMKDKGIKDLKSWYDSDVNAAREWEAEQKAYRNEKGELIMPTDVLWGTIMNACKGYKIKISGKNTAARMVIPVMFKIKEKEFPIYNGTSSKKPATDYEIEFKIARVPPRTGARVPKAWPLIFPWRISFGFECSPNVSVSHAKDFKRIVEYACEFCGFMDGRPGLGHFSYGTARITEWTVS